MADKPSRALVLYGDGLAQFVNPSHTHIHSLASKGSCGFLSLPNSPPSESEDGRIVREFAQLLDACEAYHNMSGEDTVKVEYEEKSVMQTIAERFMGMRAAIVTSNSSLKSLGGKLGFTMLQLNELLDKTHPLAEPLLDVVAPELLKLLGLQEGKTSETSQFDLVFVHIGAGENTNSQNDIEYVNGLMIIIPAYQFWSLEMKIILVFHCFLPRQSYIMKGGNLRKNIRHHCPMLIAQWQSAVTRKDMAETFSFKAFKEHGGNLTIPADRFLHEVAFKIWKAPKYGA
ncbi:hypothetical protein F0562_011969 [Nyssa sinensis]|uniref:Uncharacterized protein n=1 Tax=Nyssa sinensis TaxID=561372 RepID=A0A5J4ZRG5_9ASTE|nr:hypothetical protein F0562_011969 [Nyssa sinensis]